MTTDQGGPGDPMWRKALAEGLAAGIDDHWHDLQQECDLNLLAALVEGTLPPLVRERVEAQVAANPFAQSLVEQLRATLTGAEETAEAPLRLDRATHDPVALTRMTTERTTAPDGEATLSRSPPRTSAATHGVGWQWAIAASVLVAGVGLLWGWRSSSEQQRLTARVARLDARWKAALEREAQFSKSLLADHASRREPVYLVGSAPPGLLAAVLAEPARFRGPEEESAEERATFAQLATAAQEAAAGRDQALRTAAPTQRLEQVSLLLLAGRLEDADRELRALEADPRAKTSGAVSNARGVWHLARARQATTRAAELQAWEEARQSLETAAERGEASAWLNLAKLRAASDDQPGARAAAVAYLEAARPPAAVAEQIREKFSLPHP